MPQSLYNLDQESIDSLHTLGSKQTNKPKNRTWVLPRKACTGVK